MRLAKIEQVPDFAKDLETGGVVNTNTAALSAYRVRRKTHYELEDTKARLHNIENELSALKELITSLKK